MNERGCRFESILTKWPRAWMWDGWEVGMWSTSVEYLPHIRHTCMQDEPNPRCWKKGSPKRGTHTHTLYALAPHRSLEMKSKPSLKRSPILACPQVGVGQRWEFGWCGEIGRACRRTINPRPSHYQGIKPQTSAALNNIPTATYSYNTHSDQHSISFISVLIKKRKKEKHLRT